MKPSEAMVQAHARSDASFDGRGWDAMPRADRVRYTQRAQRGLHAAFDAMWQPIETAPKDGTEILVYRQSDYDPIIACWSSSEVQDPDWDGEDDFECWFSEPHGWLEGGVAPERWAPLPQPKGSE